MNGGIQALVISGVALIGGAVGWLFRQYWHRREVKRKAAQDASEILKQKKAILKEKISKTPDAIDKEIFHTQMEEVDAALLGLYSERLRHTLKEAGLPAEEMLRADGRSQLQPQQVAHLKDVIAEVNALPPSMSYKDFFVLSTAYYHMRQYEDAKNILNQALNLNPDDPTMLNNRGVTYNKLEKYNEALADFNHSLEIRPDHPDTITNRGATYYDQGRYDEALSNQGRAYARLGRYDEALADFNRSLELKPGNPDTIYDLACVFSLWSKQEDSIAYLKRAIELDRKSREKAKRDEDFDNIRDDPRFKKLVESD